MQEKDRLINEIGVEILNAEDLEGYDNWQSLSVVIDIHEGHSANSGYIYFNDDVDPFMADSPNISKWTNLLQDLRECFHKETGHYLKQMLVQIGNGEDECRMNTEFEFDDPHRWSITPANMKEMKEKLRPVFE